MKIILLENEKYLAYLIYGSITILALGLLTSTTLLALSHILIIIPAFYFINKTDYKNMPKSAWALLCMTVILILSVVLNQDIAVKGIVPAFKAKYFLISFLSLSPFYWYMKNYMTEKNCSRLIYMFCIATTIATMSGLCAAWFGYNPLLMKTTVIGARYGGLFGMVMNYSHNMSFFLIIITGLLIYKKSVKKLVNIPFLILVLIINIIGIYFSYTRGAWLGYLIGIPFFFLKGHKKLFVSSFSILAVLGVCVYFLAGERVIRPKSETERISQWKAAIKAFEERPVLGYGYLNFESHSGDIKKRYNLGSLKFVSHAHNNFLEMLGSSGVLGFLSFLIWLFFWAKEMYMRDDVISRIGLSFIVVFIVGGLTQSTITLGINLFFIMAVWSLTTAFTWSKK